MTIPRNEITTQRCDEYNQAMEQAGKLACFQLNITIKPRVELLSEPIEGKPVEEWPITDFTTGFVCRMVSGNQKCQTLIGPIGLSKEQLAILIQKLPDWIIPQAIKEIFQTST